MVYAQSRIHSREEDVRNSLAFYDRNRSPNQDQTTRSSDNLINQKVNLPYCGFSRPGEPKSKKKKKKKKKIETSTWTLLEKEKRWCTWNSLQKLDKRPGKFVNQKTNRHHPNYKIVVIGQDTKKRLGDLSRLAVAQTLVKDHELLLVWKIR